MVVPYGDSVRFSKAIRDWKKKNHWLAEHHRFEIKIKKYILEVNTKNKTLERCISMLAISKIVVS